MTLRFLIILLLMLNLLAYAIVRGWLGEAGQLGEPHRISGQLHPERIRLSGDSGPQAALVSAIPALPGADASEDGTTATIAEPEMPPVAPETGPEGENDAAPTTTSAPSAVDETQATVGMSATNGTQASEQTAGTDAEDPESDLAEGDITTAAPSLGSPPAAPAQATCQAWVGLSGEEAELLAQRLRRIGHRPRQRFGGLVQQVGGVEEVLLDALLDHGHGSYDSAPRRRFRRRGCTRALTDLAPPQSMFT